MFFWGKSISTKTFKGDLMSEMVRAANFYPINIARELWLHLHETNQWKISMKMDIYEYEYENMSDRNLHNK